METLEELKNTYKKLQEESNNLYSKIKALEKRNAISKFTVGDYIIKGINGEFYPCKPDIFDKTYEEVTE